MASIKEIIFKIKPKTKEAQDSLKRMSRDTKNFDTQVGKAGKSVNQLGGGIKKVGVAIAGAFAIQQVIAFGKASLEAYDKQVKAEQKLLTALKGRTDVQQNLIKQAQELQKVTLFGDEETIQAQAFLASMGLNEEAIMRLIPLVQDLATKQNMDLASSADLIAKSVGSSTNALNRYGIDIQGAVGSTERLDSAIEELNKKVGGQAAAAALVGTGSLEQIENRMGDLQEKIGELILRGINPFIGSINTAVDVLDDFLPVLTRVAENAPLLLLGPVGIFTAWGEAIFGTEEKMTSLEDALASLTKAAEGSDGDNVKAITTIQSLNEELKKLKKEYEETDITTKELAENKAKLTAKENELAAATGKLTDAQKEQKKAAEDAAKAAKELEEQKAEDLEQSNKNIEDLSNQLVESDLLRESERLTIEAERRKKEVADTENKALELWLIDQNLIKDLEQLKVDFRKDQDEADQLELDKAQEQADKLKEIRRKNTQDILNLTLDSIGKAVDAQVKAIDFELEVQQGRVNKAVELAEMGNVEQLKLEEKRLSELQDKRRKAIQAEKAIAALEIAINTALTISNIIRASALTAAQTGVASPITVPITLAAIAGGAAIAGTLFTPPSFAKGTEMITGGGSETSDDVPAMLSRGERVVTAKKNKEYWSSLSAIHNGTIPAQAMNDFVENYTFERKPFTNNIVAVKSDNSKELKEIRDILKSQRGATFNIDENGISVIVDRVNMKQQRMSKFLG